jgi:hypothetical protein
LLLVACCLLLVACCLLLVARCLLLVARTLHVVGGRLLVARCLLPKLIRSSWIGCLYILVAWYFRTIF